MQEPPSDLRKSKWLISPLVCRESKESDINAHCDTEENTHMSNMSKKGCDSIDGALSRQHYEKEIQKCFMRLVKKKIEASVRDLHEAC